MSAERHRDRTATLEVPAVRLGESSLGAVFLHLALWPDHQAAERIDLDLRDDPFFDPSLVFDLGKTDARTIDKILYGE